MSHPLLTLSSLLQLSVHACLRQGCQGVLSLKRSGNRVYVEEKQCRASLFQLKKENAVLNMGLFGEDLLRH